MLYQAEIVAGRGHTRAVSDGRLTLREGRHARLARVRPKRRSPAVVQRSRSLRFTSAGGVVEVLISLPCSRSPRRVLAATVVAGGPPFEDEADLDGLIELNRDAWHAAQEGWEARSTPSVRPCGSRSWPTRSQDSAPSWIPRPSGTRQ